MKCNLPSHPCAIWRIYQGGDSGVSTRHVHSNREIEEWKLRMRSEATTNIDTKEPHFKLRCELLYQGKLLPQNQHGAGLLRVCSQIFQGAIPIFSGDNTSDLNAWYDLTELLKGCGMADFTLLRPQIELFYPDLNHIPDGLIKEVAQSTLMKDVQRILKVLINLETMSLRDYPIFNELDPPTAVVVLHHIPQACIVTLKSTIAPPVYLGGCEHCQ